MENLGKLEQRVLLDSERCVLLQEIGALDLSGPLSSSSQFHFHTPAGDCRRRMPGGLVVHCGTWK